MLSWAQGVDAVIDVGKCLPVGGDATALSAEVWARQTIKEGGQCPMGAGCVTLGGLAVRDVSCQALTSGWDCLDTSRRGRCRFPCAMPP